MQHMRADLKPGKTHMNLLRIVSPTHITRKVLRLQMFRHQNCPKTAFKSGSKIRFCGNFLNFDPVKILVFNIFCRAFNCHVL